MLVLKGHTIRSGVKLIDKHTDSRRTCCYLRGIRKVLCAYLQCLEDSFVKEEAPALSLEGWLPFMQRDMELGPMSGTNTQRGTDGAYLISATLQGA